MKGDKPPTLLSLDAWAARQLRTRDVLFVFTIGLGFCVHVLRIWTDVCSQGHLNVSDPVRQGYGIDSCLSGQSPWSGRHASWEAATCTAEQLPHAGAGPSQNTESTWTWHRRLLCGQVWQLPISQHMEESSRLRVVTHMVAWLLLALSTTLQVLLGPYVIGWVVQCPLMSLLPLMVTSYLVLLNVPLPTPHLRSSAGSRKQQQQAVGSSGAQWRASSSAPQQRHHEQQTRRPRSNRRRFQLPWPWQVGICCFEVLSALYMTTAVHPGMLGSSTSTMAAHLVTCGVLVLVLPVLGAVLWQRHATKHYPLYRAAALRALDGSDGLDYDAAAAEQLLQSHGIDWDCLPMKPPPSSRSSLATAIIRSSSDSSNSSSGSTACEAAASHAESGPSTTMAAAVHQPHGTASSAGGAAAGGGEQEQQPLARLHEQLVQLLGASSADSMLEGVAASGGVRLAQASHAYEAHSEVLPVTIKVDTSRARVNELAPVLRQHLVSALSYGSLDVPVAAGDVSSRQQGAGPQQPAWAMHSVCFEGCVQLLASVYHPRRATGAAADGNRVPPGFDQQAVARRLLQLLQAPEAVVCVAPHHHHDDAPDLQQPAAAAGAAPAAAQHPHHHHHHDHPQVKLSVGTTNAQASLSSAAGSRVQAEDAGVPQMQLLWQDIPVLSAGAAHQQQPVLVLDTHGCLGGIVHPAEPEATAEQPSPASSSSSSRSLEGSWARLLLFSDHEVLFDEDIRLHPAIRLALPPLDTGVYHLALLPQAAPPKQQPAASRGVPGRSHPHGTMATATPLLLQVLLVLPAGPASELQRLWTAACYRLWVAQGADAADSASAAAQGGAPVPNAAAAGAGAAAPVAAAAGDAAAAGPASGSRTHDPSSSSSSSGHSQGAVLPAAGSSSGGSREGEQPLHATVADTACVAEEQAADAGVDAGMQPMRSFQVRPDGTWFGVSSNPVEPHKLLTQRHMVLAWHHMMSGLLQDIACVLCWGEGGTAAAAASEAGRSSCEPSSSTAAAAAADADVAGSELGEPSAGVQSTVQVQEVLQPLLHYLAVHRMWATADLLVQKLRVRQQHLLQLVHCMPDGSPRQRPSGGAAEAAATPGPATDQELGSQQQAATTSSQASGSGAGCFGSTAGDSSSSSSSSQGSAGSDADAAHAANASSSHPHLDQEQEQLSDSSRNSSSPCGKEAASVGGLLQCGGAQASSGPRVDLMLLAQVQVEADRRVRHPSVQLLTGFGDRVLEVCYLEYMARHSRLPDLVAAVLHVLCAAVNVLLMDRSSRITAVEGLAAGPLQPAFAGFVVLFTVPSLLLVLGRQRLLRGCRREVAVQVVEWCTAISVFMACWAHAPIIHKLCVECCSPWWRSAMLLVAVGIVKPLHRQVRLRSLLPSVSAESLALMLLQLRLQCGCSQLQILGLHLMMVGLAACCCAFMEHCCRWMFLQHKLLQSQLLVHGGKQQGHQRGRS